MLLLPIRVETMGFRYPWLNIGIIGVTCIVFLAMLAGLLPMEIIEAMVLEDFQPAGLFGHLLLHADIVHLVGNMVFLWVFGNAICSKIGNAGYLFLYLFVGIGAAAAHLLIETAPAVGASGAINGIIGFYIALHPINRIHCVWWFWFRAGVFEISGFWLVLLWVAFDLWGAMSGSPGVAYWAHLGGLAAGFSLALLGLFLEWIAMTQYDNETVLDYLLPNLTAKE